MDIKKIHLVAAVLIVIVILISSVAYYYYLAPPSEEEPTTIKIGVLTCLSPPGAYMDGLQVTWAATMAAEEINEAGGILGKELELVFGDSWGTPEKGKTVLERMIIEDGIIAAVGPIHSSETLGEMEVANELDIILMPSGAIADEITAKQYPCVFRTVWCGSMHYVKLGRMLYDKGFHNVVVVAEDTDFGISASETLSAELQKLGVPVTVSMSSWGETDYVPILTNFVSMEPKPDAFVSLVTGANCYAPIRQAYEVGLAPTKDTVMLQPQGEAHLEALWETVGEAALYLITYKVVPIPEPDLHKQFANNFKNRWGEEAAYISTIAYDNMHMLADAIERAGTTDFDALVDAMEDIDLDTTQGRVTFPTADVVAEYAWAYHQWMEPPELFVQYTEMGQLAAGAAIIWPESEFSQDIQHPP